MLKPIEKGTKKTTEKGMKKTTEKGMNGKVYLVELDIRSTASVLVFAGSEKEACDIAYDKYIDDPEDTDFDWESSVIEGTRVVEEYDAEE